MGDQGDSQISSADSNNSNGQQNPPKTLFCLPTCKYERKSKKGNKQLDMIRCCLCMHWYHDDCVVIGDNRETTWNCESCRLMPSQISMLLNELRQMKSETQNTLRYIQSQCDAIRQENKELKLGGGVILKIFR